jgi:hypothetical protein
MILRLTFLKEWSWHRRRKLKLVDAALNVPGHSSEEGET